MSKLIMFHGAECPHCRVMHVLVDRLEKETGIVFERLEVWHNEQNADAMRSYRTIISAKCGGQLRVPTFINVDAGDAICGEMPYDKLKEWALK
jgi:thiol-disulfide isomerase/thioredoxin